MKGNVFKDSVKQTLWEIKKVIHDDGTPCVPSRCAVLCKEHFSFSLYFIILFVAITFTFIIPLLFQVLLLCKATFFAQRS